MSKFQLMTKDQEDLVAMVHDFMEKKVDPYVDQWDRESHCPMEEVRELIDLGFWGHRRSRGIWWCWLGCDHHYVHSPGYGIS